MGNSAMPWYPSLLDTHLVPAHINSCSLSYYNYIGKYLFVPTATRTHTPTLLTQFTPYAHQYVQHSNMQVFGCYSDPRSQRRFTYIIKLSYFNFSFADAGGRAV